MSTMGFSLVISLQNFPQNEQLVKLKCLITVESEGFCPEKTAIGLL